MLRIGQSKQPPHISGRLITVSKTNDIVDIADLYSLKCSLTIYILRYQPAFRVTIPDND